MQALADLLTTAEAAATLAVRGIQLSRATVQAYARQGKFPGAWRMGQGHGARWCIPRASVEQYQPRARGRPWPTRKKETDESC